METLPDLLFCEHPLSPGKPDDDYAVEYAAALAQGFHILLFDFDTFSTGDHLSAMKRILPSEKERTLLYRGWMLTPADYTTLYHELRQRNYFLINTPEAYRTCHYLPENLPFIAHYTPHTIFAPYNGPESILQLLESVHVFGNAPVIVKDYVKSEKHDWETACFVPDATDRSRVEQTINRFIELRGEHLNEGIVIRAFEELQQLTIHSKSGMSLTEEYRLFFLHQRLIGIYDYWEEGDYTAERPDTSLFEKIAGTVPSAFFTMDIARKTDGTFTIIELGDGQVSGLPETAEKESFYQRLRIALHL